VGNQIRDGNADTACCRRVVIMNINQQTLAISRGYILENHVNYETGMCKVQTLWEKWG
jgi:hypothetical protein